MMNFRSAKLLPVFIVASLVVGCEAEISGSSRKAADSGSADFSTFVAIGDSLTAGFADSALYRHGQVNSYPAILAQQFALAGGGSFAQPLRGSEFTGSFLTVPTSVARDRLMIVSSGVPSPPVTAATIDPVVSEILVSMPGNLYNNFGVPLAKSFHLTLPAYGVLGGPSSNPFYARFAPDPGVTSMLDDAVARMPTFFILWIGNNDILLNALSGSDGANPTLGTGATEVTPIATFDVAFPGLVTALKTPTNKGLLINIPKISTIPYFTTVPFNAIPMTQAQADAANSGFAAYNFILQNLVGLTPGVPTCGITQEEADRRTLSYVAGQNAIVMLDETLSNLTLCFGTVVSMRQATAEDYVLLPTASKLGEDAGGGLLWGISAPLLDADVLSRAEDDGLEVVRAAYNVTIKAEADAEPDILFLDAAALLEELDSTGISYGSGGISSAYIQGGGFSADGIHPTARGYAVIANEISKVINEGFDAFIPPVDPSDYTTVFYQ
jgi:lysophospholipase L1-like esterase